MSRWIVRSVAVIAVACAIGIALSWSVSRGYLFDLLEPSLQHNPRYNLTTELMRSRNHLDFNMITIGSPAFVDNVSAVLAPCVKNLPVRLPLYHYLELHRSFRLLSSFDFDYLFIENHPAFWSNVLMRRTVPQHRQLWEGFRRRNQPLQVRADLRIAFTLFADAIMPIRPVKNLSQRQLKHAYSHSNYYEDLERWDRFGTVEKNVAQIGPENVYWFMGFDVGPATKDYPQLRKALEDRFTVKNFEPALGHLYSIEDHREAAEAVSKRICKG